MTVEMQMWMILSCLVIFRYALASLPEDNKAIRKTTSSSGDLSTATASKLLVDTVRSGDKCAVVNKKSTRTWLSINLGTQLNVHRVIFVTRTADPAHNANFKIMCAETFDSTKWTSNTFRTCYEQGATSLGPGLVMEVYCQETCVGQYIVIEKTKNYQTQYLQFGELEVFMESALANVALHKAAMHHTHFPATYVTDGFANGQQCTQLDQTDGSNVQWIRVDLGRRYVVTQIRLVKSAKEGQRLGSFKLIVTDSPSNPEKDDQAKICYTQKERSTQFYTRAYCKRAITGRYVYLVKEPSAFNPPVVCEFIVIGHEPEEDLASCKPTHMVGNSTASANGVDGHLDLNLATGTCVTTPGKGSHDWWAVDMGAIYRIHHVLIMNTVDNTFILLKDFKIMTVMDLDKTNIMSSRGLMQCRLQIAVIQRANTQKVICDTRAYGRYLLVVKRTTGVLQFCHVGVYGEPHLVNLALGKSTSQSSIRMKQGSHLAVDGKWKWDQIDKSCAVTHGQASGSWFQVDLGEEYNISAVSIQHNLKDCSTNCLVKNDFKILVSSAFISTFSSNKFITCYSHVKHTSLPATDYKLANTFYCTQTTIGRHVVISVTNNINLVLCELAVYGFLMFDNLAIGRPVTASSYESAWDLRYTHDGWRSELCASISGMQANAEWWHVDLRKAYHVRRVIVTQEKHALLNLEVNILEKTSDFDPTKPTANVYTLCGTFKDYGLHIQDILCARNNTGTLVLLLRRSATRRTLRICEVEVYGSLAQENLAMSKQSWQSTELSPHPPSVGNAIDGVYSRSLRHCSNTAGLLQREWYAVDLSGNYTIEKVVLLNSFGLHNRSLQDLTIMSMRDFEPTGFDTFPFFFCTILSDFLEPGETKQFGCQPSVIGRYLVLLKFNTGYQPFSLCELEVYGTEFVDTRVNLVHPYATTYSGPTQPAPSGCVYTAGTQDVEWWAVDLFNYWRINSLVFVTRGGTFGTVTTSHLHVIVFTDFTSDDMNDIYPGSYTGQASSRSTPTSSDTCMNKTYSLMAGEERLVHCTGQATGRFLAIAKTNARSNPLKFCDLRVYGTKVPPPANFSTGTPNPPPPTTQPGMTPIPGPDTSSPGLQGFPLENLPYVLGALGVIALLSTGVVVASIIMKQREKNRVQELKKEDTAADDETTQTKEDDRPRSVSSVKTIVPGGVEETMF